jgi:hypothetical protein
MEKKVLNQIQKEDIDLSIIRIIIDSSRLGNEGVQFLCSQELSHITYLNLGKTIDIKLKTKYRKRECFIYREPAGQA